MFNLQKTPCTRSIGETNKYPYFHLRRDLPGSFQLFSGSTVALRFIQPPYSTAISAAVQPSIFFVLLEKFTPTPTTGLPSAQAAR